MTAAEPLDTLHADAHTSLMRTLAAFAVFAVFAVLLVGAVVWASNEDMTPQQTLAALVRGAPQVPDGLTSRTAFKAYVDPGPKSLGAIGRAWAWVTAGERGAAENAIVYTVYKTEAEARKSIMANPPGLNREGPVPGVPHSVVFTGRWKGYGMTLLAAADGLVIYQALSLKPGRGETSGNYAIAAKLLPSARTYLMDVRE